MSMYVCTSVMSDTMPLAAHTCANTKDTQHLPLSRPKRDHTTRVTAEATIILACVNALGRTG